MKESVLMLAYLISITLSPSTESVVLTRSQVIEAGELVLGALSRLKHMGAISEAQAALQSIAESLLR